MNEFIINLNQGESEGFDKGWINEDSLKIISRRKFRQYERNKSEFHLDWGN